jgi:rare lipoprotein A
MKTILLLLFLSMALSSVAADGSGLTNGLASWYGESHRGRLMANGDPFNPDQLTAASWFYPLGSRIRIRARTHPECAVIVTVTDRGPAKRLVQNGRIIDLSHAAFKRLASPDVGLVPVTVEPL